MVNAGRADFVRLHSLTQAEADRARYEVREEHEPTGEPLDGAAPKLKEKISEAS